MKLCDIAKVIRSKNAGPFNLTIDIMFDNEEEFKLVKSTGVMNKEHIADLYHVPVDKVQFFVCDNIYSFKVTFPLSIPGGGIGNLDTYGAQQHAPLMDIELPI